MQCNLGQHVEYISSWQNYDPLEVLTLVAADFESDDEDFDKSDSIIIEQVNSSQDDEDKCTEDESLENENLHSPNSNSGRILSRDRTVWENRPSNLMEEQVGVTSF